MSFGKARFLGASSWPAEGGSLLLASLHSCRIYGEELQWAKPAAAESSLRQGRSSLELPKSNSELRPLQEQQLSAIRSGPQQQTD